MDSRLVTSESDYRSRREFLAGLGALGLGAAYCADDALAMGRSLAQPDNATAQALRRSIAPVGGSAFTPGARADRYKVDRPMTQELVAAKYNNFYEFSTDKEACWRLAQSLTVRPWTIEIGGLVSKPVTIGIDDLIRKMPCEERVYRFRCVERWAMVVPWSGFAFKKLMDLVEPLSSAKFVRFTSFHRPKEAAGQKPPTPWQWPYHEGLTIREAANELTFVATGLYGHDIPRQHGAPFRMVVPWKYGYKGAKSIVKIEFSKDRPHTFWNDAAPHEYGFFSNINPEKPHPRWSQRFETMVGTNKKHETIIYNGYAPYVAHLYKGDEH